ncbi:MAG: hypothetical protein ACK46Q_02555 [Hyphomonas sp.]
MRTTEARTHLPIAAGVAFLGLGFILIGSLAVPRADAQPAAAQAEYASLQILNDDGLTTAFACEKF